MVDRAAALPSTTVEDRGSMHSPREGRNPPVAPSRSGRGCRPAAWPRRIGATAPRVQDRAGSGLESLDRSRRLQTMGLRPPSVRGFGAAPAHVGLFELFLSDREFRTSSPANASASSPRRDPEVALRTRGGAMDESLRTEMTRVKRAPNWTFPRARRAPGSPRKHRDTPWA